MEIWVAIIALVGTVFAAVFHYWSNAKHARLMHVLEIERKQLSDEMQQQVEELDFSKFLLDWGVTEKALRDLMESTNIDRFLILKAINGTYTPRWTTAFFQMRSDGQKPYSYIHVELDKDYVDRLIRIVNTGPLGFEVNSIPDSLIKSIYSLEGVKHSFWVHLETHEFPNGSAAITYCSFSTREDEITEETKTACHIFAGRLKGLASVFRRNQAARTSGLKETQ